MTEKKVNNKLQRVRRHVPITESGFSLQEARVTSRCPLTLGEDTLGESSQWV